MRYQHLPIRLFTASVFCLFFISARAQNIENVVAVFADGKVTVTYNLTDGNPKRLYHIELLSSHNNFAYPLRQVAGDIGQNVAIGPNKKVVWDASSEMGKYKGSVSFRVKAEMIALAFAFKTPTEGTSLKRGKTANLQWEGGTPNQNIKLEVHQGKIKVADIAETKNTEQYTWAVPKNFKKGKDYSITLSDGKETVTSSPFMVKARIPLWMKLSPIVIVAVAIRLLFPPEPPPPPFDEKLAPAPNPN